MDPTNVYDLAEFYDIAMDFKDVAAETDFLIRVSEMYGVGAPSSVLDIGAGPGKNACEVARRGMRSVALDLSPEMLAYTARRAAAEDLTVETVEADMAAFAIGEPVDLAAIFQGSLTVLLDNDDVIAHLHCVADALVPGGLYVLENEHPRDLLGRGTSVEKGPWETERDGITVRMEWGRADDPFDPTTQIGMDTVTVVWERDGDSGEYTDIRPNRQFTATEFKALVAASARFDVVAEYGALELDVPFSAEPRAWRHVPVLRRRD